MRSDSFLGFKVNDPSKIAAIICFNQSHGKTDGKSVRMLKALGSIYRELYSCFVEALIEKVIRIIVYSC